MLKKHIDERKIVAESLYNTIDKLFKLYNIPEDYVSYMLFSITGCMLYRGFGKEKFNDMVKDIRKKAA